MTTDAPGDHAQARRSAFEPIAMVTLLLIAAIHLVWTTRVFRPLYADFGTVLPQPTQVMFDLAFNPWVVFAPAVALCVFVIIGWLSGARWARVVNYLLLALVVTVVLFSLVASTMPLFSLR